MPTAPKRFGFRKQAEREAWRTSTKTTTQRGYGWDHQKARDRLLKREPLCRECKRDGRVTVATIADHTISLAQGGDRSADNLQPLCTSCHRAKTLSEAQAGKWKG